MKYGENYYMRSCPSTSKTLRSLPEIMDKVFKDLIGINVYVCTDDMVVKFESCDEHVKDLGEFFVALRKHRMRLNPVKYVFEAEGGNFLGFMLTY